MGFIGVSEQVWDSHIGGYQVSYKWIKDRKDRTLSDEDIAHYQKIVVALTETIRIMAEIDDVVETHGGWPVAFQTGSPADATSAETGHVIPFRPRTVDPAPEDRYVTSLPSVPLKAAAGGFSDPQHIEDDDFEWVAVDTSHRLRKSMFVAQAIGSPWTPRFATVRGASSELLSRARARARSYSSSFPTPRTRRPDSATPSSATRAQQAMQGDSWRHEKITLEPFNPDFEPIVVTGVDEDVLQVIAELVEVLGG